MRLKKVLERVVKGPSLGQQLDAVQAQLVDKQQQLSTERGKLTALQAVLEARERKVQDLEKDKLKDLSDKMLLAYALSIAELKQETRQVPDPKDPTGVDMITEVVREWFEIVLPTEKGGAGNLAARARKALEDMIATL